MLALAAEGRLGPHSLIAADGSDDWRQAIDAPEFSGLFAARERLTADPSPPAPKSFGTRDESESRPQDGKSQFAVVVDLKSHAPNKLEQAIMSLGPAYKLLPNVWIVTTEQSVNAVRNRLVQELGKLDCLFVVDATRGKAARFNFGPEADARIRKVWMKAS
jgi:hypothetical protein